MIRKFNEMYEDRYDYDHILRMLKADHGWGFGSISYVDDFESNDLYFFDPKTDDQYAEQFHVYLTDQQSGQLRGRFNNRDSVRLGKWQTGTQANSPVSIYNRMY